MNTKTIYLKYAWVTMIGLFLLNSCQNVEPYDDVVYFTGTESSADKRVTVETPTSIAFSITTSCKAEQDIIAKTEIDPAKVEEYNKKEGTEYKLLPESTYRLSTSELIIEKGDNTSVPFELMIQNLEEFEPEVTYLLPISIKEVLGGLSILEASRTIYVIVSKPLITKAANISGRYFKVPFETHSTSLKCNQLSYEARVRINKFQSYSPFISTVMGIEGHFCFRFGDVAIKPNQIQIAGKGVETTAPTELTTGKWYHLVAVFDGSNVKIYIDGRLDVSKASSAPWIDLRDEEKSRGFYIGRSSNGRPMDGDISEVRVWNRALTPKEILNNMCGVKPDSEGLVAYWRFNEGEGNQIQDWTGHGWDLSTNSDITWVDGVRCPGE